MNITGFEKIAPYLTHPLVLTGFVLMLACGIHWQLMKSGLLSQVGKKDSSLIIRLFLRYGFWLALVLLLAGFGVQFSDRGLSAWNSYMDKEKVIAVNAGEVARELLAPLQGQLEAKDEKIKALTEAVTALSQADAPAKDINAALRALEQGDTKEAQAIFAEVATTEESAGQQHNQKAAEAYRHLGALAFLNDIKAALAAYEKSTVLDPNNTEGWNWLGNLLCGAGNQDKENRACAKINLGNMYLERGKLDKAEQLYREALEDSWDIGDNAGTARAIGNLGSIYFEKDELVRAEEMYNRALAVSESLENKEGKASNCSNLGLLYAKRGDLDRAEEMHRKALELDEALGSKEGMASDYDNLGSIYDKRGDLDRAEQMYGKALELHEALDSKKGIAQNYYNLGSVYYTQGDLDRAEEIYKKSLKVEEALGRKERIAYSYGCLGLVYAKGGELGKAEAAWRKSMHLYQAIGHSDAEIIQQWLDKLIRQPGTTPSVNAVDADLAAYRKAVEIEPDNAEGWNLLGNLLFQTGELVQAEEAYRKVLNLGEVHQDKEKQAWAYGNLGNVYLIRGDLDRAEEMNRKALKLYEVLGSKRGMAKCYDTLGVVYDKRGEPDQAEEVYMKSLKLNKALGSKEGIAQTYGNLGNVYLIRGDLARAEEVWKKSLKLFQEMGHPSAKRVQQNLDKLAQQRSTVSQ